VEEIVKGNTCTLYYASWIAFKTEITTNMKNQGYDVGINSAIFAMAYAFIGYCELCLTLDYLKDYFMGSYETA
jgi:hypothetical protein